MTTVSTTANSSPSPGTENEQQTPPWPLSNESPDPLPRGIETDAEWAPHDCGMPVPEDVEIEVPSVEKMAECSREELHVLNWYFGAGVPADTVEKAEKAAVANAIASNATLASVFPIGVSINIRRLFGQQDPPEYT